jgi:hypothetical protein
MAAFAVAIVSGLAAGNETSSILLRSLMAMVLCYPVGLIAGLISERTVDDHARAHRKNNPVPIDAAIGAPADAGAKEAKADKQEVLVV